MSGLTDWERHRLADLEQRLALEDPGFAARLGGSVRRSRPRGLAALGWALMVIGAVLLLSGGALRDTSVTLVGVLTLACCWLPIWYVRRH